MTISAAISGRPSERARDGEPAVQPLADSVVGWLTRWVADRLDIAAEHVQLDWEIADLDLDSTEVLILVTDVMHELAVLVSPGEVLGHRSLATLGAALSERVASAAALRPSRRPLSRTA
ncbi:MAG: hypothetical protein JWP82_911 [Humibacillus sp.]|nr:hypothetical protein [Humibacillus sp.]